MLVVEDEFLLALELEEMLRGLGVEPLGPFGRLEPARAAAEAEEIHGALLDVRLGGERTDELAALLLARGVPVILATGSRPDELPEHLRAVPCLTKPYEPAALRRLLAAVFGSDVIGPQERP